MLVGSQNPEFYFAEAENYQRAADAIHPDQPNGDGGPLILALKLFIDCEALRRHQRQRREPRTPTQTRHYRLTVFCHHIILLWCLNLASMT